MDFTDFVKTVTNDRYAPKVVDNVLNGNVLLERFLGNAQPWSGGTKKIQPIKYQTSGAGGSYEGWDTFSTSQQNTRVNAEFKIKQNYYSVVLSGIQLAVNKTEGQVLDILATEMKSVQDDMMDELGTQFYSDGTGNSSKDVDGLDAAVDDGNGTATYAGLARSTYTTWVSDLDSSTNSITLAEMRASHDAATHGNDSPTLAVTTPSIWTTIEGLLSATINYHTQVSGYPKVNRFGISRKANTGQTGDIGFDAIFFRGTPVVRDEKCTSGRFYFLNENHLMFETLPHADYATIGNGFSWTGLKTPTNQDAKVGQFLLYGNLTADSVRTSSYMTNKS